MPDFAAVSFVLWGVWLLVGVVQFFRHRTPTRVHPAANRGQGAAPLEAAAACGADVSGGWKLGGPIELMLEDRRFRLVPVTMSKSGPTFLSLGTDVTRAGGSAFRSRPGPTATLPELPRAVLRPENERDRLGKRLRFNAEIQTGDTSFDRLVYIETEQRAVVETLLSLPEVRAAALAAMSPETSVVLNDDGSPLALRWHVSDAPATAGELRASMVALAALADVFPAVERVDLVEADPTKRFLVGMGVFLGLVAMVAVPPQVFRAFRPLGDAFQLTGNIAVAIVLSASLVASWLVSRGRPRGLARFYWLVALALIAAPLCVPSALAAMNGVGVDVDGARKLDTKVLSASRVKNKNSTTCSVQLAPWRGMKRQVEAEIPCQRYDQARELPDVHVVLGEGRLGWEWVDRVVFRSGSAPRPSPGRGN